MSDECVEYISSQQFTFSNHFVSVNKNVLLTAKILVCQPRAAAAVSIGMFYLEQIN